MREIGRLLKDGRQALGLEIGDVARQTCISSHYIRALEDGKFQIIPRVFDKGYLKIYANFLHIDIKPLMALYEQKKNQAAPPPPVAASKTA
ncbi:MAG TPA: helix-turn-helix domain-containing protein [Nitrospirota bacterium]|nr:helix-turn-helix domain-containing protein [Nitrospirota bacterium]